MKKILFLSCYILVAGCSEKKEEKTDDPSSLYLNERLRIEALSRDHVLTNCKEEFEKLKSIGFTSENPEIIKTPEYIDFKSCARYQDKVFLVKFIKSSNWEKNPKKINITEYTAVNMLNATIFNDITWKCTEKEIGYEKNTCHEIEIKKIRNSLGVD